jgi:hypothetical protein
MLWLCCAVACRGKTLLLLWNYDWLSRSLFSLHMRAHACVFANACSFLSCCCRDKALLFLWDAQQEALHGVFRPSASERPLPEAKLPGARQAASHGTYQVKKLFLDGCTNVHC